MAIQFRQLDETNRDAFAALLCETWQHQTWCPKLAEEIVWWRYFDRPNDDTITLLAMDGERCVGMLDSMLRPYMLDGTRIMVRETADWYCQPQARAKAVGLMLMFKLRRNPEPMFVLGGSPTSVEVLSKMPGWVALPKASSFVLPVKVRGLVANVMRRKWWKAAHLARMIPGVIPSAHPRRIRPPFGRRPTIRLVSDTGTIGPLSQHPSGLVQLFEQPQWDWLVQMPTNLARVIGIEFHLDSELVGFCVSQIEPTTACLDGRIMYMQTTDPALTGWILSETTRILMDYRVEFIRCCVSTHDKIEAMKQVGYLKTRDYTCHWSQGQLPLPRSVDVGYLRVDDAIPFEALRGRRVTPKVHRPIGETRGVSHA